MSSSINIQVPVAGQPNSTEDPKIAASLTALQNWFNNPAIQAGDLAANAVTTAKIADSTGGSDGVTGAKLATGAVTTAKLADSTGSGDGVTTSKIATGAVTTDKVADSSIPISKIRVFTRPPVVNSLPCSVTGTGGAIASVGASTITNLTFSNGASRPPLVGQKVTITGSYLSSDTIITQVTGSGTGPYTLTLNRQTIGSGTGLSVAVAPQDGDECYYNTGNGVLWHFRYREAEATYKWMFVGGPSVYSGVLADSTGYTSSSWGAGTAGSYGFLGTSAPNYINGEFAVTLGCRINSGLDGSGPVLAYAAPVTGDGATWSTPADADAIIVSGIAPSTNRIRVYTTRTVTMAASSGLASYIAFRHKLSATATTSVDFVDRSISISPIRAFAI